MATQATLLFEPVMLFMLTHNLYVHVCLCACVHAHKLGAVDCDCLEAVGRLQANAAAEGRAGEQAHAGAATGLQPTTAMHGAGPAERPVPFGLTPQQQHLMLQQQFAMQQQQQLLIQQQVTI